MSKFLTISKDDIVTLPGVAFLTALKTLAAGWGGFDLADATSLEAILANGTARLREDAVREAAEGAGLGQEYAAVIAAVGRIEQLIGSDAGKSLLRLLSQVDRFSDDSTGSGSSNPGLVRLPTVSGAVGGGDAALSFNIGAEAAIECEAGDLWPFRTDVASDPGLSGLVRLQVEGEAEAGAAATLPLKFGSFGVAAEAKAEARLAWYLTPASPKQIFADAIVAAVPRLPLPTRFDALWNACQSSNLKGVVMVIDGKVALSAELALATTGTIPGVGGIGAGVTVKARVQRASAFQLSARAIGKPGGGVPRPVVVTVTSAKSRQTTLGAEFSVTLDATDLREKTAGIVRSVIKEWDDRLEPLEKYLSPGTFLRDELGAQLEKGISEIVKNTDLKKALVAEARRALGIEPDDGDLQNWLRDTLIDAFSKSADKVHDGANEAIADVVRAIPITNLQDAAKTKLQTELRKLLDAFDTGLKSAVAQIAAASAGKLADLLARLGVKVDGAVTTIDRQLAEIRKLLKRFNELLAKIAAATKAAANFRLQIVFATETVTREWSEFLFTGTFSQNTPETCKLFEHLVAGHIDRVAEMLEGGNTIPGVVIDKSRSFALRGKGWEQSTSVGLFILGFEIGSKLLLSAEAVTRVTSDGIVVTGKAGAERIDTRPDGSQIVRFTSPYALAAATGSDPQQAVMGLMLDINRFEKDLREGELADFLDDLVRFGLLSASVPGQAQAVLRRWRPIGGANNTVPGRIELGFALDGQAMARLYRRSDRINRNLPPAVQVEIAGICVTALKKAGVVSQKTLDEGLSLARALVSGEPTTADVATQLLYIANYRGLWDAPGPGEGGLVLGAFETIVSQFGGEGLDGRRRKGKLLPLLDALDALGDLALASPLPPDNWREADYLAAMRRVSEGVAGWLGSNRSLVRLDDDIRPQLIAFMLVIRSLAQLPQSPAASALPVAPLYLVLSRGPKGDEDRTVIV